MAQVGTLTVDLIAQTASFNANITKAAANLNSNAARMNRSLAGIQGGINRAANAARAASFALAGGALIAGIKSALDYAGSLGELSQQLGVTSRDLQVYRSIGMQAGVAQEDIDRGLQKLTLSLGNAAAGAKEPIAAFSALGINVRDATGHVKTAGQVIPEIAGSLSKVSDSAQRMAAEVALGGKSFYKFDTILTAGKAGIIDLTKATEMYGGVIEDHLIDQADRAADRMAILNQQMKVDFSREVAKNAEAILGLARALNFVEIQGLNLVANYPKIAATLAGAAIGSRFGGLPGAIIGGGAGNLIGTVGEKGAADANMDMSFRFQQRSRAYKNLQAEQAERGKRNGLFSLRREPTPTAGFSLPNAKAEFERQQRLYKQASLQLNTRPAAPGPVVNLPQFKGGGGGGGARRVPRGGGGPSVADKAVETAKRNAEDFAQELARLNDDLLSVKRENLTDLAQIATIDRQQIGAAAMQLQTTIEADVISGKYSRAQADQLEEKGWQVAAEKLLTVNTQQAQQQSDDLLRFQLAANDNQRELLDIQGRLAMTAEDRRRVALNLLALDKQEEKARLDAVIASAKAGALEKQIAAARLSQLDALYSARGAVVAQDTAGPLEAYAKSLTMTPGQINEAVQQIKVDGLKALNDGLVDAIVNFKSLGDVASNVIRTIASELVQLAVSKYITGPLANILGLGAGGGGGGTAGTVSSGISFLGKSFGGRANGGPVNAGRPYLVGERGIPEMFVPATGGRIVPLTRPPMPGRGANERTWTININFPAGVSAREARQSGAQAARAFREEQGRQMRIGG